MWRDESKLRVKLTRNQQHVYAMLKNNEGGFLKKRAKSVSLVTYCLYDPLLNPITVFDIKMVNSLVELKVL